jgi:hypothetical protein
VFAIASIRDEIFQCSEQKSTKPPLLPIGVPITTGLDQVDEKALRQILRILASISFFAQENVQRAIEGCSISTSRTCSHRPARPAVAIRRQVAGQH